MKAKSRARRDSKEEVIDLNSLQSVEAIAVSGDFDIFRHSGLAPLAGNDSAGVGVQGGSLL